MKPLSSWMGTPILTLSTQALCPWAVSTVFITNSMANKMASQVKHPKGTSL